MKNTKILPEMEERSSKEFRTKAGLFLAALSGAGAVFGFGATLVAAKKQDARYFSKGFIPSKDLPETGASLALRALGWGTLYAFTGCGILFYTIWKLSGANTFEDFRIKMGEILPAIPKKNNSTSHQGRTEFSGFSDLLQYLQEEKGSNNNNNSSEEKTPSDISK